MRCTDLSGGNKNELKIFYYWIITVDLIHGAKHFSEVACIPAKCLFAQPGQIMPK